MTATSEKWNYKTEIGNPMQLGAKKMDGGINFAIIVTENVKNCSLILYEKNTKKIITELVFTEEMRFGNIYAMLVKGIAPGSFEYNYRIENRIITDPYATMVYGATVFGENNPGKKTSGFYSDHFDWTGDRRLNYEFADSFIYRLHVRGFTMGKNSGTRRKGTFLGIIDKIDYLKSLGVTMVELMPAYEFNESIPYDTSRRYEPRLNMESTPVFNQAIEGEFVPSGKVDFWGYRDADYFMPKVAYSSKKNPSAAITEFKTLVRELHKNGIEICMEFFFGKDVTPAYMLDCLRHWVFYYHIDAVHVGMDDDIRGAVSADPYLSRTKIISFGFDGDNHSNMKHLGEYNQVFMNTARKFLKADEGQVSDMAFRFRYNKEYAAPVNYIATNDSFTLMDMVSYDTKHNEENGENNTDGTYYNYSWNCGIEGETKRKHVLELRKRQMKNALAYLFLSQGTPLLYAGDEFGNSCQGNNNPYCQDNDISYLDWRLLKKNAWLVEYVKSLVQLRKEHQILHMNKPLEERDYRSLGMPELSFHSERTWSLDNNLFSRTFGVMLNGAYCKVVNKPVEENLFIAFNSHWESKTVGLPSAGRHKKWELLFSTVDDLSDGIIHEQKSLRHLEIPPRCVLVLSSILDEEAILAEQKEEKERLVRLKKVEEQLAKKKKMEEKKKSLPGKGEKRCENEDF